MPGVLAGGTVRHAWDQRTRHLCPGDQRGYCPFMVFI